MVDLQETPATPPVDYGGDPQLGWLIAAAVLIFLGWWMAVVVNIAAHLFAPSGGYVLIWVHVYPSLGPYAWAILGLGLVTGALGVCLLALGRRSPRGPIVLPGYEYRDEPSH